MVMALDYNAHARRASFLLKAATAGSYERVGEIYLLSKNILPAAGIKPDGGKWARRLKLMNRWWCHGILLEISRCWRRPRSKTNFGHRSDHGLIARKAGARFGPIHHSMNSK